MTNYTKTTDFAAKDSLPSGNAAKIVKGSEIDTEFNNIATASATKANANDAVLTGTTTAQTLDISGNVDVDGTLETDALSLNGVTVTSTAAELNILDGVTATAAELNILDGVTSTTAELNILDGVTSTTAELNILDGVTATTAELNYVDGVTSAIQTQLDAKAPTASPTFTGNVTVQAAGELRIRDDGTFIKEDQGLQIGNTSGTGTTRPIRFYTESAERMRIDSGGGINKVSGSGATLPAITAGLATGEFKGSADSAVTNDSGLLRLSAGGGTTVGVKAGIDIFRGSTDGSLVRMFTGGTERLRINDSGNVGVGTASPSAGAVGGKVLHVQHSGGTASVRVDRSDASTSGTLSMTSGNTTNGLFSTGSKDLAFSTNSTERVRIDSSGNVGIGTSSPARTLHITSALPGIRLEDSDGPSYGEIIYNEGSNGLLIRSDEGNTDAGSNILFEVDGTERMRIDSSGQVGIGTISPATRLEVSCNLDSAQGIRIENNSTGTSSVAQLEFRGQGNNFFIKNYGDGTSNANITELISTAGGSQILFGTVSTERMRIDSSGNLGLGTSSPAGRLDVRHTVDGSEASPQFKISGGVSTYSAHHWLDATAYYIGQNSNARRVRIYSGAETAGVNLNAGGTSWGTFSDERLKYDVEPVENALESLSELRTVKYRLKNVDEPDSQKKIGVVAQDLVGVLDEVIDPLQISGDDTEYMTVRYTELVPVLIKAIQEQQETITALEARIAQLENN